MNIRAISRAVAFLVMCFAISLDADAKCANNGAQPGGWVVNVAAGLDGLDGARVQFRQENEGDSYWYIMDKKLSTPAGEAMYTMALQAMASRVKVQVYCTSAQTISAMWTAQ